MPDEDDYGRRRSADFSYALTGGKAEVQTRIPTHIEKMIQDAPVKPGQRQMSAQEMGEVADVIVKSIEKMGVNAPPPEQEKMVSMMLGPSINTPELTRAITNTAVDQVRQQQGMKASSSATFKQVQPVAAKVQPMKLS